MINRYNVFIAKDFVQSMFIILQEAMKDFLVTQNGQNSMDKIPMLIKRDNKISFDVGIQVLLSTSSIKLKTLGSNELLPR